MLIEHTKPCSRFIGPVHLIPGFNDVDTKLWDEMAKSKKWGSAIKNLETTGIIVVKDPREKPTISIVEKTYDINLLEEWLTEAKGPLKGAIKKQIKAMAIEEDL